MINFSARYYQWRIQDFSEVGAPTLQGRFCQNFQKLHEIERIWTPGGRPSRPLRSATDYTYRIYQYLFIALHKVDFTLNVLLSLTFVWTLVLTNMCTQTKVT